MKSKRLTIQAKKYDGRPHYSWEGIVLKQTETYYCNICLPSVLQGETLSFINLDLVHRNGEWQVVDEDEFLENQQLYHYPVELIERVCASMLSLTRRIGEKLSLLDK
ncbi:DUF402 domain-containing protein [Exiguobacterium acetylicum]|uniref:DUF402 domain-containing protein n=1 Tax=Exiguobacterium acetylicum TaxID=41170 RepID=UPI003977AB64